MKRFIPIILLPILFACGKKEEQAPMPSPSPQPAVQPAPPAPAEAAQAPAVATPAPKPAVPAGGKAKPSTAKYAVVKGDTLYSIARKQGVNYHDLAKWNNIQDPNQLRVGQELSLTAPGT
jgi:lipoprotein NlpD